MNLRDDFMTLTTLTTAVNGVGGHEVIGRYLLLHIT